MNLLLPPLFRIVGAIVFGLLLSMTPVHVFGQATATDLADTVRGAIEASRLKVQPYVFNPKKMSYQEGGVVRAEMEYGGGLVFSVPVDTICILEAGATGLGRKERERLEEGCRAKIHAIVQTQLDLIAKHKGTAEELHGLLNEQHDLARQAFEAAAEKVGFRPISEGSKRWTVRFVTEPKGGNVFVLNAGDYDVFQWCQKKGIAKDKPDWLPALESESFGHDCLYYVCAKWDGRKNSEVTLVRVTGNKTITLKQAP